MPHAKITKDATDILDCTSASFPNILKTKEPMNPSPNYDVLSSKRIIYANRQIILSHTSDSSSITPITWPFANKKPSHTFIKPQGRTRVSPLFHPCQHTCSFSSIISSYYYYPPNVMVISDPRMLACPLTVENLPMFSTLSMNLAPQSVGLDILSSSTCQSLVDPIICFLSSSILTDNPSLFFLKIR
eukprot:TRINITY_DN2283_c0_g1_i4.p1 TRINITY_DN2283_c0_g1~~TRINITY_DN2283_c0_g1_i4.p1  ORF type:complete len:187 (-),score=9.40 TRINITY_DN2283_c0_g1_i4:297-857(-)